MVQLCTGPISPARTMARFEKRRAEKGMSDPRQYQMYRKRFAKETQPEHLEVEDGIFLLHAHHGESLETSVCFLLICAPQQWSSESWDTVHCPYIVTMDGECWRRRVTLLFPEARALAFRENDLSAVFTIRGLALILQATLFEAENPWAFCEKAELASDTTVVARGLEQVVDTSALLKVAKSRLERAMDTAATPWCVLALGALLIRLGRSPTPAAVRSLRSQRSLVAAPCPSSASEAWLRRFDDELRVPKELLSRRALGKNLGDLHVIRRRLDCVAGFLEVLD